MKTVQTVGVVSAVLAMLILSGCNNNSTPKSADGTSEVYETPEQIDPKVITIDWELLLNADVTDNSGQVATRLSDGQYRFDNNITYPVSATNGYIDANNNGIVNEGEVVNDIEFKAIDGRVITLASTIALDTQMRAILEQDFGLTTNQITSKTPSEDQDIEAFTDTLFTYILENSYSSVQTISEEELKSLFDAFMTLRNSYESE